MANTDIIDIQTSNKIIKEISSLDINSGDDYEFARNNIKNLVRKGQIALDNLLNLADQSQQFEGYDSATNLIKALIDGNKQLLNVKKTDKEISIISGTNEQETTLVNNNLYITPSDLLDLVIDNRNSENSKDDKENKRIKKNGKT